MPQPSAIATRSAQAMSIKYNTMVYELTRQGQHVTVMSLGEPFFDIPLFPMDDLPYPDIYHYSDSRGLPELREKLAEYFGREYDVPIDANREILVTAGSKAAIYMALMAILNPGDEVIIHEPAWVSYAEQVKLCYGVPVAVPRTSSIRDYRDFVTDRTRAIIVNTPHNPTGYVWTTDDLHSVLDLAREKDLWILSDEAYSDFVEDGTFVSMGRLDHDKTHTIVVNSISKNYGISGWRLGYVIANADLIDQILKINQHLITCPATILEHYVARHFTRILEITLPQIRGLIGRRRQLARHMDELGLQYVPGTGTFYFFVSIAPSRLSSEAFCTRLLTEDLISAVPGIGYGQSCDSFIRISVGNVSLEQNMHGLLKIKALIDRTS